MTDWMDKPKEPCQHDHVKDFSFYDHMAIKQPNFYCPDCGCHWLRGEFYSKEEWEVYINGAFLESVEWDKLS